jgi:hypothetical protein
MFVCVLSFLKFRNTESRRGGCLFFESVLKLLFQTDSWLSACVAIERAFTVFKGVKLNKAMSESIARWTIRVLPFFFFSSFVSESMCHDLFDDNEDHTDGVSFLCSHARQTYRIVVLIFHFLAPFVTNLLSASFIIVMLPLPRLVISLLVACMKDPHNRQLYLWDCFASFVPSTGTFVVFVPPSLFYKA